MKHKDITVISLILHFLCFSHDIYHITLGIIHLVRTKNFPTNDYFLPPDAYPIRSYSGPHFPEFGLNARKCGPE